MLLEEEVRSSEKIVLLEEMHYSGDRALFLVSAATRRPVRGQGWDRLGGWMIAVGGDGKLFDGRARRKQGLLSVM